MRRRNPGACPGLSFAALKIPRRYTVGPGRSVRDSWILAENQEHLLSVTGPNGFLRRFRRGAPAAVSVQARHDGRDGALVLHLRNTGPDPAAVRLPGHGTTSRQIALAANGHWYDVSVLADNETTTETRLAGHVETGRPSITDPAATRPVLPA